MLANNIRVIVAESFADIYENCCRYGLVADCAGVAVADALSSA